MRRQPSTTIRLYEAALHDLKSYQHRLNSDMSGALCSRDFGSSEAFNEWKKSEAPHLSQMIMDILTARPDLAKSSTSGLDLPLSLVSPISEDDETADGFGHTISGPLDLSSPSIENAAARLEDTASIRSVDEANYTFIPHDPRSFYKAVLQVVLAADQAASDPSGPFAPLQKQTEDLLLELAVHWRIPQASRLITLIEVAVKRFTDGEAQLQHLDVIFDMVKSEGPEMKKPPHVTNYSAPLTDIDPQTWTVHDREVYRKTLQTLHEALLRDLYNALTQCYEPKPPSIAVIMNVLMNNILNDSEFSPTPDAEEEYARVLSDGLRRKAADVYRSYLDKELPPDRQDWNFGHVVRLGQAVLKLAERIKKRYKRTPEIMGANPMAALVETTFPSFEADAKAIVEQIMDAAAAASQEIPIEEGFLLYKELVEIRRIHVETLPSQPFGFDIEELLVRFVWRWIEVAESKMDDHIVEAVKQDKFTVRTKSPEDVPSDSQRHSVSIIDVFTLFNQTAEQIFQLGWDNDVHYARFMTALARVFANGIGRYCELVWEIFQKEMDRPSAQEVAMASMSAQEKFLQYAREAWNNKEKVEPFQFYAEVGLPATGDL
jgi:hypothetical protein